MRPLPAVLLDLHEDYATGKLLLRRGRVSKSIELVNGNPVSALAAPRDETLGHFLVSSGVITEEQHRQAVARAAQHGGKLADALVGLRALTASEVIDQLGHQVRHKLVQSLRWPQGAWRFDDVDVIDGKRMRMVEIVLGGLRETAVDDLERLARLDGMRFELTERGVRLKHELRRAFGDAPIALLDDGAPIEELERAFGDRTGARSAIDAMMLCDAVQAGFEHYGLGAGVPTVRQLARVRDSGAFGYEPTRPLAPGSALFDILFDDIGYASDPDADGGSQPIEFPDAEADAVDSGVVSTADVESSTATVRRAGPPPPPRGSVPIVEAKPEAVAAPPPLIESRGTESAAFNADESFAMAIELMAARQWAQAISLLKKITTRAPGGADYHAALGWAEWLSGGETAEAADVARVPLNKALELDADHAAAHDYKGRIDAALGGDDAGGDVEALFHLERALELDPERGDALRAAEGLYFERGELRRYERTLKRLLFRLRGRGTPAEAQGWARLAALYLDHLDDDAAAAAAAASANRIAPDDAEITALVQRAGAPRHPRAGWREALGNPRSGAALVSSTHARGHIDAAFLAASTMVAFGTADDQMAALYEAHRVRGAVQPAAPLGRDQWALLRHPQDAADLGGLMELVAPAVHALAPMTLADSELDETERIPDTDLPPSFARLRARYAALLGVPLPAVYSRVELGAQIHVVAAEPPVLIAGDDALTAPERPELAFSLVRAMTFLWPGRAVGASRPGRVLRAAVMAIFREASGTDAGAADDPLASRAADAVAQLAATARVQARAAALRLLSRGTGLNLSLWARSLSRTADRAGMVLCGDIPAAFSAAKEIGELDRDLVEFAFSAAHVQLRNQLGLGGS